MLHIFNDGSLCPPKFMASDHEKSESKKDHFSPVKLENESMGRIRELTTWSKSVVGRTTVSKYLMFQSNISSSLTSVLYLNVIIM